MGRVEIRGLTKDDRFGDGAACRRICMFLVEEDRKFRKGHDVADGFRVAQEPLLVVLARSDEFAVIHDGLFVIDALVSAGMISALPSWTMGLASMGYVLASNAGWVLTTRTKCEGNVRARGRRGRIAFVLSYFKTSSFQCCGLSSWVLTPSTAAAHAYDAMGLVMLHGIIQSLC